MDASATTRISRLQKMSLEDLRAEYETAFGKPTKSRNRKQLFAQIARKLQGDAVPKPTLTVKFERKKKGKARKSKKTDSKKTAGKKSSRVRPIGQRDARLPKPGTDLVREWHGKKYVVRVLESGVEHDSKPFRSLSAVAKHITGQIVNGFVWFGLGLPSKAKKSK